MHSRIIDFSTFLVFSICFVISTSALIYYTSVLFVIVPWLIKHKPADDKQLVIWSERKRIILKRGWINKAAYSLILSSGFIIYYFLQ